MNVDELDEALMDELEGMLDEEDEKFEIESASSPIPPEPSTTDEPSLNVKTDISLPRSDGFSAIGSPLVSPGMDNVSALLRLFIHICNLSFTPLRQMCIDVGMHKRLVSLHRHLKGRKNAKGPPQFRFNSDEILTLREGRLI